MKTIPDGCYIINASTRTFIHVPTQFDYGKYLYNWDIFGMCGLDDTFESGYISITKVESEDDWMLVFRNPVISYDSILKLRISEVFDIESLNKEEK